MGIDNKTLENISSSPIKNFYEHLQKNLDESLSKFLDEEAIDNKTEPKKISEIGNEIQNNKSLLAKSLKECNIGTSLFFVILIIPTFLILIGFLFLKPFRKYLTNIRKYLSEKKKYKQIINNLNDKINYLNTVALGTFNLMDFLSEYFKSKGIKKFDVISNDKILEIFKKINSSHLDLKNISSNNNVVDIKGIECRIRNNPFYDVVVRKLEIHNVVTSNSKSFSYQATQTDSDSNGNTTVKVVTKYETLTAFHNELTPFIESQNIGIYETKFAPGLNFNTNSQKRSDIINLENEDFSKTYRLNKATNRVELNSFFTIKAQEDYMSWFLLQNKYFPFYKIQNYIFIEMNNLNKTFSIKNNALVNKIASSIKTKYSISINKNDIFLESLVVPKKSVSDFIILEKNKINSKLVKKEMKDSTLNYVHKFSSAAILPLLSPAISREAFRDNNDNYFISQSLELIFENDEATSNNHNFSKIKTLSKLCDIVFFDFLKKKAKKPMWLEIIEQQKIDDFICLIKFNLKSFYSENKIDLVSVYGIHVGHKIIPVNYEEFHAMSEEKEIIYLAKQTNIKSKILISRIDQVSNTFSTDEIDNKYLLDNNVWTNNPKDLLEDNGLINKFKILVARFYEISALLSDDAKQITKINMEFNFKGFSSLLIDKDGIYFIHNSNINKSLIQNIKQLLKDFSELNFI